LFSKTYSDNIQKAFKAIDWKLLIFLVLFLNVKLVVKLAAIILIYILQFNFKFGFRLRDSRLPLFYPLIISIAVINYVIITGYTNLSYTATFLTGIGFWLLSIFAMHQVKLSVDKNEPAKIHQTILVFFIINACVSLATYLLIVYKTGAINPYLYQGEYQKYFISTGDYIKGISFDTSNTNAVINAFGVIYFFSRKNGLMVLLCMTILLLTASNITNLLLCAILLVSFIFFSDRYQKSLVLLCFLLLVIFMTKVSPQNNTYIASHFENFFNIPKEKKQHEGAVLPIRESPDSILTPEERKQKAATLYLDSLYRLQIKKQQKLIPPEASLIDKIVIPTPNINSAPFQYKSFITPAEENMLQFVHTYKEVLPLTSDSNYSPKYPGKIIAWKQTVDYFSLHPSKVFLGTGIGNFSSKLAFKSTGLKMAGSYPQKFTYMNNDFIKNHLDLYLYYFTKRDELHSIVNSPNSVYVQLLSEYGLLGLCAFFIFYIGFFARKFKKLTYGIPLIFLLASIFFVDYWFEQLSIVVFFELLLFLNIKEGLKKS
jgi:hypothetical protein